MPRPRITDPDELRRRAWEALARAVADRRHPFHQPVIATVRDDRPEARTVVLRRVFPPGERHPTRGLLIAHTDARSPKVDDLRRRPALAWLFYDPGTRLQLRVRSTALVLTHDNPSDEGVTAGLHAEAWARTAPFARRCYLAPFPPSSTLAEHHHNLPDALVGRAPTPDESAPGIANFAVIAALVEEIDLLDLHHDGHVRALVAEHGTAWLAP